MPVEPVLLLALIDSAAKEVPELVEEIEATSRRVRALPLDRLVQSGTRVLGSVNTLVSAA